MNSSARPDDPIDCHVGSRIWQRRRELGFSRRKLGEMVGVGLKQVNKYELGINRVSAGRLYEIAKALDVPVGYFFQGAEMSDQDFPNGPNNAARTTRDSEIEVLLDVYHALPRDVRGRFLRLVRSIADTSAG